MEIWQDFVEVEYAMVGSGWQGDTRAREPWSMCSSPERRDINASSNFLQPPQSVSQLLSVQEVPSILNFDKESDTAFWTFCMYNIRFAYVIFINLQCIHVVYIYYNHSNIRGFPKKDIMF